MALTAQEEAERLWNAVELVLRLLPSGSAVDLGHRYSEEVVRALAAIARTHVITALHLEEDGPHRVCVRMGVDVGRVYVSAACWRPATPGDAALRAYRFGLSEQVTPEEAAKALGVSQ